MRATTFFAMARPVSTEPVKLTPSTSVDPMSASPTADPRPMTRLNTPAGTPARRRTSARAHPQPGTRSAGLKTTQFP
jgi:hypothetical protein